MKIYAVPIAIHTFLKGRLDMQRIVCDLPDSFEIIAGSCSNMVVSVGIYISENKKFIHLVGDMEEK
jgi:MinD-like ATPase involved in chromosome partitioning or flagellar assembly